jgi:hypothetical protein
LGGALAAYLDADLLLYNNVFVDNVGYSGGAILAMRSASVLIANTVVANRAGTGGGAALYLNEAPAWIERNLLAENTGSAAVFCLTTDNLPFPRGNAVSNAEGVAGGACPDFTGIEGNCAEEVVAGERLLGNLFELAEADHCAPDVGARAWAHPAPAVPADVLALWRDWVAKHARDPAAAQGLPAEAGGSARSSSSKMRYSTR